MTTTMRMSSEALVANQEGLTVDSERCSSKGSGSSSSIKGSQVVGLDTPFATGPSWSDVHKEQQ